jgi:alpha-galactosidase
VALEPISSTIIALRSAGVMVLLDASDGRLPAVVHWGPVIPALDEEGADTLIGGSNPVVGPNDVDIPARLSIVPELRTGWTGHPGLKGSRDGASCSRCMPVARRWGSSHARRAT